jgi:hypothetical protein
MTSAGKIPAALLFLLVLCPLEVLQAAPETQPSAAWRVEPCDSFGPIQGKTSLADLIRLFGKDNVRETRIEGAEGETYPGAIVFPNDPLKKLKLIWKDDVKNAIAEASVEGEKSVWKTAEGVTLGTTLRELNALNGRAFTVSGFGWDYGGRVLSWNGGALAPPFPKAFSLQLSPNPAKPEGQKNAPAVTGDKALPSSLHALQALEPRVVEMSCQFP